MDPFNEKYFALAPFCSVLVLGYPFLFAFCCRCTPLDVVFQSSSVTVTCLNCSSEIVSQGFFIGQPKDVYCRRCHNKITITAMGLRFLQHQQSDHISQEKAESVTVLSSKKQADILLKDGLPLPEYGICQHYKKSHRWLRYRSEEVEVGQ